MRAVILLNGEPYLGVIDADGARVYCCDGAYEWAKGRVRIDENLGDYDSLGYLPDPPPAEVYPSEKNYTDGEIALVRAISAGADEIEIYGGGGKREDHFLGNLHLLYSAHERGVRAVLVTNGARIFAGRGRVDLGGLRGKTLSVVPFGGNVNMIESRGLKYPLDGLTLAYGSTRGISNVVLSDSAHIVAEGNVLVLVNTSDIGDSPTGGKQPSTKSSA